MLDEKFIKPIPKYMLKLIQRSDATYIRNRYGRTRYYAYLSKIKGELVKIIVACKNRGNKWFCKQVVVHGIHSDYCLAKNINFFYMGGYVTGWYNEKLTYYRKWWELGSWVQYEDKYFNIYCPVLNPEYALKFDEYRYCAIDKYRYYDTFKYLRIYEKYPQAEMLVKFGLSAYATSVQILRKIGKDKNFRKWLIEHKTEICTNIFYITTLLIAYKTKKQFKTVQRLESEKKSFYRNYVYGNIKQLFKTDKDVTKLMEYVADKNTNISSYSDYLNACNYLGLDMSLPQNRYPHEFKRWHDIRIDEYNTARALKDEQERKELCAKFATVAEKYLGLQRSKEAFIVVIARSPQDLIREGDTLHHCVGRMNYDQRFIREESLIFFVRNASEPDTPFVTVEYSLSKHKVLQCYGEHDHKPNDNVLEFVNKKWLPFANRQLKKIQTPAA